MKIGIALVDVGMACRVVLGIVFQKSTDLTRRSLSEMSSEGRYEGVPPPKKTVRTGGPSRNYAHSSISVLRADT